MASYIKQGESIFIPFRDGKSIYDSQNRPRIYKTAEAFRKSFPTHNLGTDGIVLTEYVPNEQPTVNVVRCKDCIRRNIVSDLSNTVISEIEDAEGVPSGTWEFKCEGTYNRTKAYCTACGKPSGIGGIRSNQAKPYCPNCGVKMRVKQEVL